MTDQEILDNAPKNTSIVDSEFNFFDDIYCELNEHGEWNWKNTMPVYPIRSLADIKRIVELEKPHDEIDLLLKELLYCCDGLYCDYAQENYGDAKNWLRHINAAYGKYRDTIDDLEALKEQGK